MASIGRSAINALRSKAAVPKPSLSQNPKPSSPFARSDDPERKTYTKIAIILRSFENPMVENSPLLTPDTRSIGLPKSRVLYTVLRSPHIDKKSREQFEMGIKKQLLVVKTQPHELRNRLFWLKRQRILGAQYEVRLYNKTRLDMGKFNNGMLFKKLAQLENQREPMELLAQF